MSNVLPFGQAQAELPFGQAQAVPWIKLDEVDSTNNFLRSGGRSSSSRSLQHLDTPSDHRMTLVTAEFQTAGRGAATNHWESAKGENLLLSLRVMPSNLPARRMFALSEVAALAVRDTIDAFLPSTPPEGGRRVCIKWPNDIYYGDKKVAGILIENDLQGAKVLRSTIGIGINVNQRRFVSDAPNPLSLASIVGHDVERRFVLEQFMGRFTHYFERIDEGRQEALDALHKQYKEHLYRFGEEHNYSDKDGIFRAMLVDVEPGGLLVLQDTKGNKRQYEFKEVKYEI